MVDSPGAGAKVTEVAKHIKNACFPSLEECYSWLIIVNFNHAEVAVYKEWLMKLLHCTVLLYTVLHWIGLHRIRLDRIGLCPISLKTQKQQQLGDN